MFLGVSDPEAVVMMDGIEKGVNDGSAGGGSSVREGADRGSNAGGSEFESIGLGTGTPADGVVSPVYESEVLKRC